MKDQSPKISVIVPVYNVEQYLSECVESLLNQSISMEIILVNDGSTDSSGTISDAYAARDNRILVVHQENKGPSETRNVGMKIASGKYISLVDSDDYIEAGSLDKMLDLAEENHADMVVGTMTHHYPNGVKHDYYSSIAKEYDGKCISGKDWFTVMLKSKYSPSPCNYIYRREWLVKEGLHFEGSPFEDELWTPIALSRAERVLVSCYPFYYYRQRDGSTMHTLMFRRSFNALLTIAKKLTDYEYCLPPEESFRDWYWVNIYRLYSIAFGILPKIRDSSLEFPKYNLNDIFKVYRKLNDDARRSIKPCYISAKQNLKRFLQWKKHQKQYDPRIQHSILVYNMPRMDMCLCDTSSESFFVTDDKSHLLTAEMVIFHISNLNEHLDNDLDKPENQIWVAWFGEEEESVTFSEDKELCSLFEIHMLGYEDIDVKLVDGNDEVRGRWEIMRKLFSSGIFSTIRQTVVVQHER